MNDQRTGKGPNLRHEYIVDARYQYRYAVIVALMGAAGAVTASVTLYVAQLVTRPELPLPPAVAVRLSHSDTTTLFATICASVAASLILGGIGIVVSHRIAGPIFVMTRHLATLASGRYPHIRPLREGDQLTDFFDLFRKSVEALRARDLEEAAKIRDALNRLTPFATTPEARAGLEALTLVHDRKMRSDAPERAQVSQSTSL
jgi:hypothetical protein